MELVTNKLVVPAVAFPPWVPPTAVLRPPRVVVETKNCAGTDPLVVATVPVTVTVEPLEMLAVAVPPIALPPIAPLPPVFCVNAAAVVLVTVAVLAFWVN